jgi:hypothetical protein
MSDITKCTGINKEGETCQEREKCYRYVAESDEIYQSYFTEAPFEILENNEYTENGFFCRMFWGNGAESIFNQLKAIVKNESDIKI